MGNSSLAQWTFTEKVGGRNSGPGRCEIVKSYFRCSFPYVQYFHANTANTATTHHAPTRMTLHLCNSGATPSSPRLISNISTWRRGIWAHRTSQARGHGSRATSQSLATKAVNKSQPPAPPSRPLSAVFLCWTSSVPVLPYH